MVYHHFERMRSTMVYTVSVSLVVLVLNRSASKVVLSTRYIFKFGILSTPTTLETVRSIDRLVMNALLARSLLSASLANEGHYRSPSCS